MDEQQLRQFYDEVKKHLTFFNDVTDNATGEDTVALINKAINKYSNGEFIKYCVKVIDSISKNDFEFCKNLFEIACVMVKYRRDPTGHEMVWSPLLLARVRKGDCKKFTTFICSVLKCKGIKSASKVVNYDQQYGWQHIYAIAYLPNREKYLVLDPVNQCKFDTEVDHRVGRVNFYDGSKSKLIMTKLSMMGNTPDKNITFFGLGQASDDVLGDLEEISGGRSRKKCYNQINELEQTYIEGMADMIEGEYEEISGDEEIGIGAKKVKQNTQKAQQKAAKKEARKSPERKAAQKEKRQKVVKKLKGAGFTPTRVAFLALIAAGGALAKHTPIKFNLAAKIAESWLKDNGKKITAIWEKFGGKRESLRTAIIKASKVQIQGPDQWDGIGVVATTGLAAAVATASPLLLLTVKLLKDQGLVNKTDATNTANLIEDVTDSSTKADGSLTDAATKVIKEQAAPLVQDAIKLDDGGNKPAQQVIKETVTPNDQKTEIAPTPQAQQTFTNDSQQQNSSSDQQARTSNTTNQDSTDTPTPQAGGFILTNASSWLTGSITTPAMIHINFPGADEMIGGIVSGGMFAVSIFLFINKYIKTKIQNT